MKISRKMTIGEFAAMIASHLQSQGISTVLTGGAVVSIYTENKYMSYDAVKCSVLYGEFGKRKNHDEHYSKNS
jgi:hypothetical protein